MIPFTGFAPDVDPTQPGVITDCINMVPSMRGMKAAGAGADIGVGAVTDDPLDVATLMQLDGSARTFAGCLTAIYENVSGLWTDVSKVGGYTNTATSWCFAQFGNVSLATNYINPVQFTTTGDFADLTGSPPKAKIVETAAGFVLLFSYNDGVNEVEDGWWCSGLYDHTAWTPSPSTQAANGRLFDTQGEITAARRLGSAIAVYKENSVYLGQYIGTPIIWAWNLVASSIGAYSQGSVIDVSGVNYFLGPDGLFMFDGSRPVPIGAVEVRQWLKDNINPAHTDKIVSGYDEQNSLIYWFFPSRLSTGTCDEAIVYNTVSGKFGRMTKNIISIIDYTAPNLTWGGVGSLASDWSGVGAMLDIWGDPLLSGDSVGLSFVSDDNKIYQFESNATNSSITTGDFGDDLRLTTISEVKPRFMDYPDTAQMTNYYRRNEGVTITEGTTVSINDGKFNLLRSDRWHRLRFTFAGNCEVSGFDATLKANGTR